MSVSVYEGKGSFNVYGGQATNDVAYPATVNANDILIILILAFGNRTAITPTNWNAITSTSDSRSVFLFWKRATGSESGNETVTLSSSVNSTSIMMRVSGCITTGTPYESLVNGGHVNANSQDTGELATTGIDRLVAAIHTISSNYTPSTPANYSLEFNEVQGSFSTSMNLFTQEQLTAGTVDAETSSTSSASDRFMQTFALIPAAEASADMSGTITTGSTLSGILKAFGELKGIIVTGSILSGNLKAFGKLKGTIETGSTLSGNLTTGQNNNMSGTISTGSVLSGILKAFGKLAGTITTGSTLSGNLSNVGESLELIEEDSLMNISIEEDSFMITAIGENSSMTLEIEENSLI